MKDDVPPPHDETAERLVLCGLVWTFNPAGAEVRRTGLRGDEMYFDLHRRVWQAVSRLAYAGRAVTAWEVWRELAAEWGEFPQAGRQNAAMSCAAWLIGLRDDDPTGYWSMAAAHAVRDLAERRRLIHAARRAIRDAMGGRPVAELMAV